MVKRLYHLVYLREKTTFLFYHKVLEKSDDEIMDLSIKDLTFVPTVVNTQSEFEEIFGTPNGEYYTGYIPYKII